MTRLCKRLQRIEFCRKKEVFIFAMRHGLLRSSAVQALRKIARSYYHIKARAAMLQVKKFNEAIKFSTFLSVLQQIYIPHKKFAMTHLKVCSWNAGQKRLDTDRGLLKSVALCYLENKLTTSLGKEGFHTLKTFNSEMKNYQTVYG
jgi:hypothetical protein